MAKWKDAKDAGSSSNFGDLKEGIRYGIKFDKTVKLGNKSAKTAEIHDLTAKGKGIYLGFKGKTITGETGVGSVVSGIIGVTDDVFWQVAKFAENIGLDLMKLPDDNLEAMKVIKAKLESGEVIIEAELEEKPPYNGNPQWQIINKTIGLSKVHNGTGTGQESVGESSNDDLDL